MIKQFFKKVGDKVWVSPHYLESTLRADTFRNPSPASQTPHVKPTTENSAIHGNQYFNRDSRRNYPRVAVYNQQEVGQLLLVDHQAKTLNGPSAIKANEATKPNASPELKADVAESSEPSVPSINVKDVTDAISQINKPIYNVNNLPPVPGKAHKFVLSKVQIEAGPGQYYPMYRVC